MNLTEDIDEMLSDVDYEDLYGRARGEEDWSERRKRRGPSVRGRGYAQPRADPTPVKHTEMQAGFLRVAEDVRKLAENQKLMEERFGVGLKKVRTDTQQSMQMAAMMPLLFKPTTKAGDQLTAADKVMVDTGDTMSMLLPLVLMGAMTPASGNGQPATGMMDPMMMVMFAMIMAEQRK